MPLRDNLLGLPIGGCEGDLDNYREFHIYTESKAQWWQITDSLPQFEPIRVERSGNTLSLLSETVHGLSRWEVHTSAPLSEIVTCEFLRITLPKTFSLSDFCSCGCNGDSYYGLLKDYLALPNLSCKTVRN